MPQKLIEIFMMIWTAFGKTEVFRLSSTTSSPISVIQLECFKRSTNSDSASVSSNFASNHVLFETAAFAFGPALRLPCACVQVQCSDPKQESESERQNCDLQQGYISFFHEGCDWRAGKLRDFSVTVECRNG